MSKARVVHPHEWAAPLAITVNGGVCLPIIWPGMGAVERSLHQFRLPPGSGTVDLRHETEAVYYVVSGQVLVVDRESGDSRQIGEGAMFHVDPGTGYAFSSVDREAVVLGGPCPADPSLYAQSVG